MKIIRPFEMGGKLGLFNTWAVVSGGGSTGQAESTALAISRGLVAHDASLRSSFMSGIYYIT